MKAMKEKQKKKAMKEKMKKKGKEYWGGRRYHIVC